MGSLPYYLVSQVKFDTFTDSFFLYPVGSVFSGKKGYEELGMGLAFDYYPVLGDGDFLIMYERGLSISNTEFQSLLDRLSRIKGSAASLKLEFGIFSNVIPKKNDYSKKIDHGSVYSYAGTDLFLIRVAMLPPSLFIENDRVFLQLIENKFCKEAKNKFFTSIDEGEGDIKNEVWRYI